MKKVVVAVTAMFVAAVMCMAADEAAAKAKEVTVVGKVAVVKDDKGVVTSVKVGEQAVKVDEKGTAVAALDGKEVEAKGTVVEKLLVVTAVAEKKAAAPEAAK